jgi:hypothetical protein
MLSMGGNVSVGIFLFLKFLKEKKRIPAITDCITVGLLLTTS